MTAQVVCRARRCRDGNPVDMRYLVVVQALVAHDQPGRRMVVSPNQLDGLVVVNPSGTMQGGRSQSRDRAPPLRPQPGRVSLVVERRHGESAHLDVRIDCPEIRPQLVPGELALSQRITSDEVFTQYNSQTR